MGIERWEGGPAGPLVRLRRQIEHGQGLRIDGEMSGFLSTWGLEGKTFAYYGPRLAGRVWQSVDTRRRVLVRVDFQGPGEGVEATLKDARAMVDSMDFGAP